MFYRRRPRFPFAGILIVLALLFIGAQVGSAAGGAASGLAFLFVLPFLALKFMFMVFLVGMVAKFFFRHGPGRRYTPATDHVDGAPPRNAEEREWDEHLRAARTEVERLFPDVDLGKLREVFRPSPEASESTDDDVDDTDEDDTPADRPDADSGDEAV